MKVEDKTESAPNVVDLSSFRKKKAAQEELARGRNPLYVSHLTGKVTGHSQTAPSPDFGDRLQRIRSSLEKINRLMSELKKMGGDTSQNKKNPPQVP